MMWMRPRAWTILVVVLFCAAVPLLLWSVLHHRRGKPSLIISRGGTYTGSFEGTDYTAPVILVRTTEPVVIDHCTLRGPGPLIETGVDHTNITVRNTKGISTNPNYFDQCKGRFFRAESFDNVVIENNDLEGTAGIYLLRYAGDFAPQHTVKILRNQAHNIDGRKSNGNGGWRDTNELVQFVQLDKVRRLGGIEIAWNQVINDPGDSAVEDNINIYKSSGTPSSPILIHDNYVQGAYPSYPRAKDYSGGGIVLGDGSAATPDDAAAFVHAYENQIVSTTNYGIAISAGHDLSFFRNRILSCGLLPDGRTIPAQNTGAYVWDMHRDTERTPPTFFNNEGHDNLIGWVRGNSRNDWWVPNATVWQSNEHWPEPLTLDAERAEWKRWEQKLKDSRVAVGITP
jgi:hypothetical protein